MAIQIPSPAQLTEYIGQPLGTSDWLEITQDQINMFADATDDHQWIHTDPERAAAETMFGGTIAHGFLTLSVLSPMAYETLPSIEGTTMGINYGFDRIRFAMPVRSGARIRARFKLTDADIRPSGRVLNTYDVTMEIDGMNKPAFTAIWLTLSVIEPPPGR